VQQLTAPWCPGHDASSVLRLFDCRHLHCTGTAIRIIRMSCGPGRCAQGSPGRCGCARCRQARPAAVVRARTHTSTRAQRRAHTHTSTRARAHTHKHPRTETSAVGSYATCAAALPSGSPPPRPLSQHSFGQNCQPSNPTNFGLVFRSPRTLGVCGDLVSNISATRGRPDMRFCVCGSPRGDLSHIASVTLGCSRSDFSGANRRVQDHTCGG
jgi:hypothetical protein